MPTQGNHLYTYLPKSANVEKEGIHSIATLSGDEWKKYIGRAGSDKKEDVLKWLDSTFPGRTRAFSCFTQPIPDNAHPDILKFRNAKQLVVLPSYEELLKAGVVEACWATRIGKRGCTRVEGPNYNDKITWVPHNEKLLFTHIQHYIVVIKNGIIPPKYCKVVKQEQSHEALKPHTWTMSDIKSVDDLKAFYKECRYGLVDWKADRYWRETHNRTTGKDFDENWKLLTPEQVLKYRCGICYDTAMMSHHFLTKWGIQHQFFFGGTKRSLSDDYDSDPTHTFVIYKDENNWKWLEGSWGSFIGNNWSESDPVTLIKNIGKAMANSSHYTNFISRITKYPKYGVSMHEFHHFLKPEMYRPQFEIEPDSKYSNEVLAEKAIKNGYLYHGSPNRYTVLKPQTQEDVNGKKVLSFSPFKCISSMFVIPVERLIRGYHRCRLRYDEWFNLPQDKYQPLTTVHVYHNIKQLGDFEKVFSGYLYTVKAEDVLQNATDNPKWRGEKEVLAYASEIHPVKTEQISVKVVFKYDLKRCGTDYDAVPSGASEEALLDHTSSEGYKPDQMQITDINNIDDLKKFYKTVKYGFRDSDRDAYTKWRLSSYRYLAHHPVGICYDTAAMSDHFLTEWGIEHKLIFLYAEPVDESMQHTHMCCIYHDMKDDMWKILDGSWDLFRNDDRELEYPYEIARYVARVCANQWQRPVYVGEVEKLPLDGTCLLEFHNSVVAQASDRKIDRIDPDVKYASEAIKASVANNIRNNTVYHSSPKKVDKLLGSKTGSWSGEQGNVFVSPCKGIVACFVIDKKTVLDGIEKQLGKRVVNCNFGYDIWNKPVSTLYEIPKNITIEMNIRGFKPFSGTSTGYLYTIDFEKYKDKCHMFNKNKNSDVEFVIEGDVDYIKAEKITVNWTCISSEAEIKRKGEGSVESFMSEYATISFPKEEIPIISKQSRIVTTRVSADYNKYHKGDLVQTPWDKIYKVVKRLDITNIKDHPYYKELTKEQIAFLSKYDKIAVLTLVLQEDAKEEYYYGMNGEEIPNSEDSASLEAFTTDNVSMEDSPVQEAGNYVIIRGFPVAAFFKQLAKHYQTHKLENLIQIVHSIGISQWTVNTRTVKIHHFFLPEIIYLLNKFNMSQTLIGDIQRGSWMGQDPDIKTDCKMSRVETNMNCNLFEHQEKFINDYAELKDSHRLRGYLLSFSQGLGKTVTSVALMEALNKERVIVICPKNTMVETWKAHFERFYKKPQTIYVSGVDKKFEGQRFCIFNYDAIDKLNSLEGLKKPNMGIIVDESHNFLRMQSARTQKLINLARTCENPDVLLMSGTPIKTSGVEMIPLISILDPLFDDEAAKIFRESFGVNTKIATEVLHSRLKRMMERVTKEVLDLPPKNKSTVKIKLPDGQKYTIKEVRKGMSAYINDRMKFHRDHMVEYRQEFDECMDYLRTKDIWKTEDFQRYKSILDRLIRDKGKFDQGDEDVAWMNEYEKRFVEPQLPSDLLHKFRHCKAAIKYIQLKVRGEVLGQFIAKLRIEMTTAMLKEANLKQMIDEAKKKTIIFTSYIDTIEACEKYVKGLGYKPIVIYGKNSGDIAPLAAKFQKDPQYNPLIASLQTLSTGATLTAANRVIFLNKPWRSIDYEQASDRVHRIGQDCAVDIISLVLDTGEEGNLSTRMEEIMDESARAFDEIVEERKKQVDAKKASNEVYFDIDDFPADIIDEENLSFEGMTLLHDTHEQRVLNRLAKPHYRPRGANSWEHVQQDLANGILLIKELKHRDLTLQEYATVLWHDSACKSIYPEKVGHGVKGGEIAKKDLKDTGFFTDEQIEEIYVAICEHDETTNPKNLHSSELSDFLASADTNPIDIPWMLNKSYVWGLRHGIKTHEERIKNVVEHEPSVYGSEGCLVYPKLYKEYYAGDIKKMQKFYDQLTEEQADEIITSYRNRHRLAANELTLPEPNTDEIVIPSTESLDISLEAIPAKYSKLVFEDTPIKKKVYSICKPYYSDTGSHGYEHIKEVLATAYVLKGEKPLTDVEYTAVLFHDTGRKATDEGHSVESERIAKRELPKLKYFSNEELEDIYKAILYHSNSWRKTHHITEMSSLAELIANADKGFPKVSYYDICLRPALWILEGHDKGNEKWKRLNQYRTLDDIAQGVMETLDEYTKKYYDPNEKSLYARVFAKEKKKQIELKNNITIDIIKKTVATIMKEYEYSLSSMESLEPSMEAANIKAKRKKIEAYILNAMKLLDPHTGTNVKYWKDKFASMNDKDFDNFMHCLREGKTNIHMFVPPFKVTLQTKEMIEAAHKLGVTIMHRIWMHDPHTGIKYLTPEKYMVLQLPMRRQQQYLDEKLSVPDNDKTIDGLTGQVTGDSKSCAITNPEIQILHARNLDATLYEFANVRGGNIRNYAEFKRSLEETGSVRLEQLDPTNRTRVAVMGQVLLTAMHLDANIAEI